MSKPRKKKNVEAVKSYTEGFSKQERAGYFDKLKLMGGKEPYKLASLAPRMQ